MKEVVTVYASEKSLTAKYSISWDQPDYKRYYYHGETTLIDKCEELIVKYPRPEIGWKYVVGRFEPINFNGKYKAPNVVWRVWSGKRQGWKDDNGKYVINGFIRENQDYKFIAEGIRKCIGIKIEGKLGKTLTIEFGRNLTIPCRRNRRQFVKFGRRLPKRRKVYKKIGIKKTKMYYVDLHYKPKKKIGLVG